LNLERNPVEDKRIDRLRELQAEKKQLEGRIKQIEHELLQAAKKFWHARKLEPEESDSTPEFELRFRPIHQQKRKCEVCGALRRTPDLSIVALHGKPYKVCNWCLTEPEIMQEFGSSRT